MLELTVIGNQGPYAGPGGTCSGYLLCAGSTAVLVDSGPGVMSGVQRHIDLGGLSGIIISHYHPDHCSDFLTMRYAFHHAYSCGQLSGPVPLCVPELGWESFSRDWVGQQYAELFDVGLISDGRAMQLGDLRFEFRLMAHSVPSFGVLVREEAAPEGGRAPLAYTSDTGQCEALVRLAREARTLLAEAGAARGHAGGHEPPCPPAPWHLSPAEAGAIARAAGVDRLILTHLHPEAQPRDIVATAREAMGEEVWVAEPGRRYTL
ncbi:MAG: MBL fold metallo-hydrolase [Firmicutes bacterium]|nr:MBL fold metallo-hydrolase [Bacillota bacterium]